MTFAMNNIKAVAMATESMKHSTQMEERSYRYQLVALPPSHNVVCPICLDIVVEPHQLTCCGQHLCKGCSEGVQRERRDCPTCNKNSYLVLPDKAFERNSLNTLQVFCSEKDEGCPMQGELAGMLPHMRDCEYTRVPCPLNCGRSCQRRHLKSHTSNDCPRRPHQCEYCGYESTYTDVTDVHMPLCDKAPVLCPNECAGETTITREALPNHIEKECPLQMVPCEFSNVCHVTMPRKDLPQHLTEYAQHHTALMTKKMNDELLKMLQDKDRQLEEREKKFRAQLEERDREIERYRKQFDNKLKKIAEKVDISLNLAGFHQRNFEMTRYSERLRNNVSWLSPPFYSHIGGYKLCFEVDLSRSEKGTYIPIYTYIMKGPFDDSLKWPFTGIVTVTLFDQSGANNHVKCVYDYSKARYGQGERVVTHDRGRDFRNNPKGLPSYIGYFTTDTLQFNVTIENFI